VEHAVQGVESAPSSAGSAVFAFDTPELLGFPMDPVRRPAAAAPKHTSGPSAGCSRSVVQGKPGQTVLRSIVSGGVKRTFRLHLPASSGKGPVPLVLNFHGRSATGIDQEIASGLVSVSDREGFVLVSPDGTGTPLGWSAGATAPNRVDDVRFVADLLDQLTSELCIDQARVYATGFSNGAFMTSQLACSMPDRIAAVAAVGGVHYPGGCGARIPVLAIHGTADDIVPIDGGIVRGWRYAGARVAMYEWAATNGCRPAADALPLAKDVTAAAYVDCAAPTEFVVIDGAGHAWPGAPGTRQESVSGAALVWNFFEEAPPAGS